MRAHLPTSFQVFSFMLAVLVLIALVPGRAAAIEAPPATNVTYLQTNGPMSPIGQGDWYTSDANGVGAGYHYYEITVPCSWSATDPVYVDLLSPEMIVDSPGDEMRPNGPPGFPNDIINANTTTFELYGPGTTIGPNPNQPLPGAAGTITAFIYPPLATGEAWRRFASLNAPVACGTYILRAETSGDDENAWRVRVGTDSDVDPTNTPPTNYDNLDGLPGTDDEILIGVRSGSYQNSIANGVDCLTLYEYVAPNQASVAFHNFDMDSSGRVRYYAPSDVYDPLGLTGGTAGTPSGSSVWNGGTITNRGNTDVIANPASGWWRIVTCIGGNNQYIQEGQSSGSAYYDQLPIPAMTVAKDDGVALTFAGDQLTYTLAYANTSSGPTAGAATQVVLKDTIPANTSYISCSIPVADGTCSQAGGVVTFTLSHHIVAGASGSVQVTVQVGAGVAVGDSVTNSVTLDYGDSFGNPYPQQSASDIDTVQLAPVPPAMTVAKDDGVAQTAPGDSLSYTLTYANAPAAGTATNVVLKDTLPANTTYVSCAILPADGTCSQAGGVVTFTLSHDILPGANGSVQVTVTVNAGATGTVLNTVTLDYQDSLGHPQPAEQASDTDQIVGPDLRLVKDSSSDSIMAGQLITYTLTYLNDSAVTATGARIAETVPIGTRFVAVGGTPGWSCPNNSAAGTACSLSLGTLVGRATGSITFIVRVDRPLPTGLTQIDNTATISDDGTHGPDPTPANNVAATRRPPLAVVLTGLSADWQAKGVQLRWSTGSELNSLGFQIYRSASGQRADALLVTPQLILARGNALSGASYSFLDTGAAAGASYSYWLVERVLGGTSEFGPLRPAGLSDGPSKVFLPLVWR